MHAGDALWGLYGGLTLLERRHAASPEILQLVATLRPCVDCIATQMQVPPPTAAQLQAVLAQMTEAADALTGNSPPAPPPPSGQQSSGGRLRNDDPQNTEHANILLTKMVEDEEDSFGWADMISDLHTKMNGDKPFITPKQWRAICNIASKGPKYDDGTNWWTDFSAAHPDTATHAKEMAALA